MNPEIVSYCEVVVEQSRYASYDFFLNPASRWGLYLEAVEAVHKEPTLENVRHLVDMFDQADTNRAVTGHTGMAGFLLKNAINRIRHLLTLEPV